MKQHYCELAPDVLERALTRVGYYRHTKKTGQQIDHTGLLSWFVKFADMDYVKLTPAEMLLRREEYRALQEKGCALAQNDEGIVRDFTKTQATIAKHLQELTEKGTTDFELQLSVSVTIPRFGPQPKEPFKHSIYSDEHDPDPYEGKGLVRLFARSLQHSGDRLRHCEHCSTLFVQIRRKQRYCTRECQQVASMRNLRIRQNVKAEKLKTGGHSKQRVRRVQHGKKKRAR